MVLTRTAAVAVVQADLRRVGEGLAQVEVLLDEAANDLDGLSGLRQDVSTARLLLGRVAQALVAAEAAARGTDISHLRALSVSVALVVAFTGAAASLGRPWWVTGLVWAGVFAAALAGGLVLSGTVLRRAVHRRAAHAGSLADLLPDGDTGHAVLLSASLASPPGLDAEAAALIRGDRPTDPTRAAAAMVGRATATLVGVPGTSGVPMLATSPALPAIRRLLGCVELLAEELRQRPATWTSPHGAEHYARAQSGLIHAHRLLSDASEGLVLAARHL